MRIHSLIRVEGVEHFGDQGQAAILLTPHFVGMDVGGQWIARCTRVHVCEPKNMYLTELLAKTRPRPALFAPAKAPILRGCARASRSFIRRIRIRVRDGAFIFGVPAATMTSVPRIACEPARSRALHHAPVAERRGYVLTFYPAQESYPGDDIADTRRMDKFIEPRAQMPDVFLAS